MTDAAGHRRFPVPCLGVPSARRDNELQYLVFLISAWLVSGTTALAQDLPAPDLPDADTAPRAQEAIADTDSEDDGTEPLWEFGIGAFAGFIPDYPAADENHFNGLAVPFAIYRGEIFRLGDGGGPRGTVVDEPWLEFNLGFDASFPVDSDDNDAREGMADLDALFEVGPQAIVKFLPDDEKNDLDLALAVRGVISTDITNTRYQGLVFNPRLIHRREDIFERDVRSFASVGPTFGFDGLNNYFYEVEPNDVSDDREEFDADDGYLGTEATLGLSFGITDRVRIFTGTQFGFWNGSTNDSSPLHKDDFTAAVFTGLSWRLLESERRVPER